MQVDNRTHEQIASSVREMASFIPDLIVKSTVAIVGARAPAVTQIGSGTLIAVADMRFIVTAAHVIREAQRRQYTIGVAGVGSDSLTALTGQCILSVNSEGSNKDTQDIAIYELDERQTSRLTGVEFLLLGDVSFEFNLDECLLVVTGFPGIWSTQSTKVDEVIKSKILQYGTYTFSGSTAALDGYDPQHHFLMQATPTQLLDHAGSPTSFRTRTGYPASFAQDLGGISGCSVWRIGRLSTPTEHWSQSSCKLVGVETGVFPSRGAIKATRWKAVASMLYHIYPKLRPVIDLHPELV